MTLVATGFGDRKVITVDADPTSTAVNAAKGSFIIWNDEIYCKMSDGENTDVQIQASAIATQAEAEAGTSTVPKLWTPQRIVQARQALISTESESFTGIHNTIHFCDTNAASADIVVTDIVSPVAGNEFTVYLKTHHATRKVTGPATLIIAGEYVRRVYDGAAWNNFAHLIACQAVVARDIAQVLVSGSNSYVDFDAIEKNIGSVAFNGTSPIVARRANEWITGGNWKATGLDDREYAHSALYAGGAERIRSRHHSPGASHDVTNELSQMVPLAAGGALRFRLLHNEGANMNTDTSASEKPIQWARELLEV